jgi:sigma-B regulation protein RsbU (phosphoserine phosphatase)
MFNSTGVFLGVVTVDVELRHLAERMKSLAKVDGGYVFLVSKAGFLLYHPDYQATLKETLTQYAQRIKSDSLAKAANAIKKQDSGIYKVTVNDELFLLYTMPVPESSWSIGVMLDHKTLFAPLAGMKLRLLIIAISGLVVILLTVIMVTNQLKATISHEERTRNELNLAASIQRSFLPDQDTFQHQNFAFSGVMQPAKQIGGDFYGYREQDGKLLFYIGDVAGKGVPASLFMMASHVLIETMIDEAFDPANVLRRTNEKLCSLGKQRMFATMMVGVVDPGNHTLTFSLAGHPPPIIKDGPNLFSPLADFLPPVGTFGGIQYKNQNIEFSDEALIVAYTDGVTEAMNRSEELFGSERLSRVIANDFSGLQSQAIRRQIEDAVAGFVNNNDPHDDLTLVVIKTFMKASNNG